MFDFNIPNIKVESSENGMDGTIVIEPLERGFGTTIGNSLRRVLLSSLPGTAAVYIQIDGALHEFTTLKGIKEDVTEIVLNIKSIIAKLHTDTLKKAYIDFTGPGTVTARDIKCDSELEIVNPDFVIATVSEGASLKMELAFAKGRGYVPAERNKEIYEQLPIGVIAVDSIFSPVLKVGYYVDNTRVGNITDYDKLTLEVKTNGSITPEEAVATASNVIIRHFEHISSISETGESPEMKQDDDKAKSALLDMDIEELELSVRSNNCLRRAEMKTVGDLVKVSEYEMMRVRNLGAKSFEEIKSKLISLGQNFRTEE